MIRLGLCCIFRDEPIKFSTTTAAVVSRMSREDGLAKLAGIARSNAEALRAAVDYCAANGIGSFRINSQILPIKTHPDCGYVMADLPDGEAIVGLFREAGRVARERGIRLGFHPDQFVVLNSKRPEVVESSIRELEHQAQVAEWVGADVLNVHGGGAFGDKATALDDFARALGRLSPGARSRLTVENDDKIYTPSDLLPTCRAEGIPLVYDVHHHRCLGDGLSIEEATDLAETTWGGREPLFHLSSPIQGWDGPKPERHHDFIDPADFPAAWLGRSLTVEVEAKAKEVAVLKFLPELRAREAPPPPPTRRPRRAKKATGDA